MFLVLYRFSLIFPWRARSQFFFILPINLFISASAPPLFILPKLRLTQLFLPEIFFLYLNSKHYSIPFLPPPKLFLLQGILQEALLFIFQQHHWPSLAISSLPTVLTAAQIFPMATPKNFNKVLLHSKKKFNQDTLICPGHESPFTFVDVL